MYRAMFYVKKLAYWIIWAVKEDEQDEQEL